MQLTKRALPWLDPPERVKISGVQNSVENKQTCFQIPASWVISGDGLQCSFVPLAKSFRLPKEREWKDRHLSLRQSN
jgi:hypothetical protein